MVITIVVLSVTQSISIYIYIYIYIYMCVCVDLFVCLSIYHAGLSICLLVCLILTVIDQCMGLLGEKPGT